MRNQERESSESPMLKAFCRVAPSVRRSLLAILAAVVFFFASVFSSRTSVAVHARRFFALLAINPPFRSKPMGMSWRVGRKLDKWCLCHEDRSKGPQTRPQKRPGKLTISIVEGVLATYRTRRNSNFAWGRSLFVTKHLKSFACNALPCCRCGVRRVRSGSCSSATPSLPSEIGEGTPARDASHGGT